MLRDFPFTVALALNDSNSPPPIFPISPLADGENRRGLGSCYTFSGLLDYDNFWEPCNGRRTDRGHKEYGLCQAGTSVAIAAGAGGGETFVFGAPGSYDWTGAVLKFSSDDSESGKSLRLFVSSFLKSLFFYQFQVMAEFLKQKKPLLMNVQ